MNAAGRFRVPRGALLIALALAAVPTAWLASASEARAGAADRFFLSDEPGNWFRSEVNGIPLAVVGAGDRVDFKVNGCCTDTIHTATLLMKPAGSTANIDQDKPFGGSEYIELDVPGVYLVGCKVHPYMAGVIAVVDGNGAIPDVTSGMLPFLGHLGLSSLDALSVLDVMTVIAPDDAAKQQKWDILTAGDPSLVAPTVPGVGEVWINTQFEAVAGQDKPGTITVVDLASFTVEREVFGGLDPDAADMWNNPHNMWANFANDKVYNSNWFGQWINKIDRVSGDVEHSINVGHAPTHIITDPDPASSEFGVLHIPLSAEDDIVRVEDTGSQLEIIGSNATGSGHNHPHGHWLQCGTGELTVVPNVFKGIGFAGSISIIDTATGNVETEFDYDPADPLRSALLMPLAAGECHVDLPGGGHAHKAYVGNVVTGVVTVVDLGSQAITKNIPVTLTPGTEVTGGNLFDTLQVPIQTPVSPGGEWVATAVFSLTTIGRSATGGYSDHVAIIDTTLDEVVAFVGTPAGTHGINWGARSGGGYYAYVTNQHSNVMSVIDPDPNGDGDGSDAAVVGQILLANGSAGAGATDGTGGQGVKPLPMVHDGWIQQTVSLRDQGQVSAEVAGWVDALTPYQQNPVP